MATLSFFLDKRVAKESYPLKMRISQGRGQAALISTGLKLTEEQWDGEKIVNHPKAKALNAYIEAKRNHADGIITRMFVSGLLDECSASDIKKLIENNGVKPVEDDDKSGNFLRTFITCMESKNKQSTRLSYETTLNSMKKYDPLLDTRSFEDELTEYVFACIHACPIILSVANMGNQFKSTRGFSCRI